MNIFEVPFLGIIGDDVMTTNIAKIDNRLAIVIQNLKCEPVIEVDAPFPDLVIPPPTLDLLDPK